MISLPRLYPIIDARGFRFTSDLIAFSQELVVAGCCILQYRNKSGIARMMLEHARELRRVFPATLNASNDAPSETPTQDQIPHFSRNRGEVGRPYSAGTPVRLIMNDRADLCLAAAFDGVHVGQDDLSPEAVRAIIGPDRWLGVSTHNPEQLREADLTSADYLAIGPVFATSSKERPDPVVGLEGVRRARALTRKPLVAIGGITRANATSVIEAGADSVAVISDLLRDPRKSAEEFFRILR
jgi:thiamine-phosphate pyrophosphorylase